MLAEHYQITRKEEIHWFQKSRCKWIIYGDKNSSYFHTKTVIRRQRNKIRMLKNDSNVWVEDEDFLRDMARLFYQNLFKREDSLVKLHDSFPEIDQAHLSQLAEPVSDEEVRAVIFDMKPYTTPGPNGFQLFFTNLSGQY